MTKIILNEVCKNCGLTFGSHNAGQYYSEQYKMLVPHNYCPGNQGQMNWDKGPGTVFESSNTYEDVPYDIPADGRKEV